MTSLYCEEKVQTSLTLFKLEQSSHQFIIFSNWLVNQWHTCWWLFHDNLCCTFSPILYKFGSLLVSGSLWTIFCLFVFRFLLVLFCLVVSLLFDTLFISLNIEVTYIYFSLVHSLMNSSLCNTDAELSKVNIGSSSWQRQGKGNFVLMFFFLRVFLRHACSTFNFLQIWFLAF